MIVFLGGNGEDISIRVPFHIVFVAFKFYIFIIFLCIIFVKPKTIHIVYEFFAIPHFKQPNRLQFHK